MPHSLVNPRAQTLRAHRGATPSHVAARLPRRRCPVFPCPSAPQADVSWQILVKGLQAELGISCVNSHLPGSPVLARPAGINLRRNQLHRSHWPRLHGAGHGYVPGAAGPGWSRHFSAGTGEQASTRAGLHPQPTSLFSRFSSPCLCLQPHILVLSGYQGEKMLQRSTGLCPSPSRGKPVLS